MCKRLLFLTAFVSVLGLAGSAGAAVGDKGNILFEWFDATTGSNLNQAVDGRNANYPLKPSQVDYLTVLQGPTTRGNNYMTRVRGYLYPPETGDYTFWTSSDDHSRVWLSTDADPANKKLVAEVSGSTSALQWTKYASQKSALITLQAGQKYYIEVLHRDGTGGDNLAVGWGGPVIGAGPVVIDGAFLSAWLRPVRLPVPADGTIDADIASLEWTAADGAVSYKVYLSKDQTIDAADLLGETTAPIQVAIVDPGVTYYWRVDEVRADASVIEGPVWSFSTLPLEAHFPNPPDGATNFAGTTLSWTAGKGAILHNVYLGTDPAALLPKAMMQMPKTLDPGALAAGTTYYWRIDEFTPGGTVTGPVWSFSTIGAVTPSGTPDLILEYLFEEAPSSLAALDTSGNNHHGALLGNAKIDSALILDGNGDCVDAGSHADYHPAGAFSVSAFINMTSWGGNWNNVIAGTRGESNLGWQLRRNSSNQNLTFTIRGTSGADDPRGTIVPPLNEWIHVAGVFDPNGGTRTVYINGIQDVQIADSSTVAVSDHKLYVGARANSGNTGPEGFFNGSINDLRIHRRALTVNEVRVLAGVEALPYSPDPADGRSDVSTPVVLTWNPGAYAVSQDIYLGTDANAVAAADVTDTTGIYRGRQAETTYTAGDLAWGATYYWRVGQVAADGSIVTGPVWRFAVPDYMIVDLNQKTLNYDNRAEPFVSELAWDVPADWTVNGITDLKLRFQGRPAPEGDLSIDQATGTYSITGSGADIWGTSDQFHYAYVQLSGDGEISARVVSNGTGTNLWAKGGVMIRGTTAANSIHMLAALTGGDGGGIAFQGRHQAAGSSSSSLHGDITAAPPYWVRLVRAGSTITGYHSANGVDWQLFTDASPDNAGGAISDPMTVAMADPVLIGLFVTSHAAGQKRTYTFDNVKITGNVGAAIEHQDVGIVGNSAEPIYVKLQDAAGNVGVVVHPDLAATQINQWWNWKIPLSEFTAVDLTSIAKFYFGVGNGQPGRFGTVDVDDIIVVKPVVIQEPADVTAPGDNVKGVPNDGVNTSGNTAGWPAAEAPPLATDNNVNTKFLHFKGEVEPTGFVVEPLVGPTVVTGLTFTTANDAAERDPITFELSGSNVGINGPYELIAAGDIVDFAQATAWTRLTKSATPITFANTVAYRYYQVMFPAVRNSLFPASATCMQIAEVELIGTSVSAVVAKPKIIWVSDNKTPAPAVDGVPADQAWVDLLSAQGYDVDLSFRNKEGRTLDDAKIAALNAADLIIISRDTDSGNYDDGQEVAQWNSVTVPILMQVAQIAQSSRWRWINIGTTNNAKPILQAVATTHPIFNGVTLDASNQVDAITTNVSFVSTADVGNGTLIASRVDNGQAWIVEWQAGLAFYASSTETPAGHRMLFCSGGTTAPVSDGTYDLTAEGEKMFLNAVAYMLQ
jgi:hypothetical protein